MRVTKYRLPAKEVVHIEPGGNPPVGDWFARFKGETEFKPFDPQILRYTPIKSFWAVSKSFCKEE